MQLRNILLAVVAGVVVLPALASDTTLRRVTSEVAVVITDDAPCMCMWTIVDHPSGSKQKFGTSCTDRSSSEIDGEVTESRSQWNTQTGEVTCGFEIKRNGVLILRNETTAMVPEIARAASLTVDAVAAVARGLTKLQRDSGGKLPVALRGKRTNAGRIEPLTPKYVSIAQLEQGWGKWVAVSVTPDGGGFCAFSEAFDPQMANAYSRAVTKGTAEMGRLPSYIVCGGSLRAK
jgi:hypothetical protein